MRRFLSIVLFTLLCSTISAQDPIDAIQLIDEIYQDKISLNEFKIKYKDNIEIDETGRNDEFGMFVMNDINLAGYESVGLVVNISESDMGLLIVPNYEVLDSLSSFQSADNCHKYMISCLGIPSIEEIATDFSILQEIGGQMNIKGGKTYEWVSANGIPYYALRLQTDKQDYYAVMAVKTSSKDVVTTPIQRNFFKFLELGEQVTRYDVAKALDTAFYNIDKECIFLGKSFSYWGQVYFGGFEWSYVRIATVEGKMLNIQMSNIQLLSSQGNNSKYVYDKLLETLTHKYGEPKKNINDVSWNDGETIIELSYKRIHDYVVLVYTDQELFRERQAIITNEL